LYALLGNGEIVAWLTPHAAVTRDDGLAMDDWVQRGEQLDESCGFYFTVDGEEISAFARSPEHLLEICDAVLRLLAVSVVHSVDVDNLTRTSGLSMNAPILAYLLEQCQSLRVLTLMRLDSLNENHCRVLGAYSRPDLEIVLDNCKITNAGARTLAQVLGRNQGPTKLDYCDIDYFLLADGLRGNSRLKSLKLCFSTSSEEDRNRQLPAIAAALRENKGLVDLDLSRRVYTSDITMSDETWGAICDSLKTHPTLEVLNLRTTGGMALLTPGVLNFRMQKVVDMMKVKTSIHTILLHGFYSDHDLYRGSVIPYLETNRFRPHLLAIQKARPIAYRAKILGRALLAVRTDPNRLWMLFSGNAEVAFPSDTTTIAATANAAANTSTANVAAVAAFVIMSDLTSTATGSLATAAAHATAATSATTSSTASDACDPSFAIATTAANAATPPAGQKGKARP
jgi:hypothetical protein